MITILSHPLNDSTPGYGGAKDFQREKVKCLHSGDSCNQEKFQLSGHIGTHLDFPYHFDPQGKKTQEYDFEYFECHQICLIDYPAQNNELISIEKFEDQIPQNCDCLLIRTHFEKKRDQKIYWSENPGLSAESALWLRKKRNLKFIGFDFISLTSYGHREEGKKAHQAFLGSGQGAPIVILEDLKLSHLSAAPQKILVSPLWVEDADGVPCTIWAWS